MKNEEGDLMENKMLTVSIEKEFDVVKKEFNNSIYLRVYTSLFQSGLVKELKATNFTVLLAIASFMDSDGNCYPTQRQIADITGMSLPTVNKSVNELLDFKVGEHTILKRELVQVGQFKNSYYTVNPVSQIAIFEGHVKEINTDAVKENEIDVLKNFVLNNNQYSISSNTNNAEQKEVKEIKPELPAFKNSKDVAVYFMQKYQEVYGVNCNIAWSRDLSLIKKKLIGKYTDEQIALMIDTSIADYEKRWKKVSYPRPTISMMCSWLGEQALAVAEDQLKEYKELAALTADSDENDADVLKKFGL